MKIYVRATLARANPVTGASSAAQSDYDKNKRGNNNKSPLLWLYNECKKEDARGNGSWVKGISQKELYSRSTWFLINYCYK